MNRCFAAPVLPGILGAVLAVSFFLPWVSIPFLQVSGGPMTIISEGVAGDLVSEAPGLLLVPLSCLLGALVGFLALVRGDCPAYWALIAGALPIGMILYVVSSAELQEVINSGFFRVGDLGDVLSLGAYGWVGSAVLLVLVALFAPKRD